MMPNVTDELRNAIHNAVKKALQPLYDEALKKVQHDHAAAIDAAVDKAIAAISGKPAKLRQCKERADKGAHRRKRGLPPQGDARDQGCESALPGRDFAAQQLIAMCACGHYRQAHAEVGDGPCLAHNCRCKRWVDHPDPLGGINFNSQADAT
jgi:hypothetical protein